jgi:hypothetical protein
MEQGLQRIGWDAWQVFDDADFDTSDIRHASIRQTVARTLRRSAHRSSIRGPADPRRDIAIGDQRPGRPQPALGAFRPVPPRRSGHRDSVEPLHYDENDRRGGVRAVAHRVRGDLAPDSPMWSSSSPRSSLT